MARVQFELPAQFLFSTEMQIYISHVNQGGHLDNAQLLTLVSEARVRFFKHLGYRESDVQGHGVVVGAGRLVARRQRNRGYRVGPRLTGRTSPAGAATPR